MDKAFFTPYPGQYPSRAATIHFSGSAVKSSLPWTTVEQTLPSISKFAAIVFYSSNVDRCTQDLVDQGEGKPPRYVYNTTMNLGAPYNEAAGLRGLVPLHAPLQQQLPVFDGVLDLVRCGHAVNQWIPVTAMEFLFYDLDRVLRGGGYLWLDRFFCKGIDLDKVYAPLIGKLGYKKVKWAVANKTDSSGVKNGEVYLTALLQKPVSSK
ncbi:hypothetical protein TEA_028904 [Camellia sinensis var. sinensis]|uniref:Methyltransferase type 11 domain-containing protein n=1 Tax=Camellia sinensis var. sinensis TaxID=542762 RepID=A0A4S4DND9_CAMSN|nr:hypothetical protein TEA_028904 [Camellia sinensis var. sinensis]